MLYCSIRRLVTTSVLVGACAALAAAQAPSQQGSRTAQPATPAQPDKTQDAQQQPPRFRVEADFVRVDAYPQKDGKPVLDLKAEDVEVFEDGAAQKIETFEHVVVRAAGPQTERVEVSSQRESLQAAQNPRNRVFVIFLDTPNVAVESAHAINEPLIRLIDRILGPDDFVAVMTPAMAASQIVHGRKTEVIENSLRRNWPWGTRFSLLKDDREYEAGTKPGAGRVLDRVGQPVQVPVAVGERTDEATGQRWVTADVVLAPLAGGDYAIELVEPAKSQRVVNAIRVVR